MQLERDWNSQLAKIGEKLAIQVCFEASLVHVRDLRRRGFWFGGVCSFPPRTGTCFAIYVRLDTHCCSLSRLRHERPFPKRSVRPSDALRAIRKCSADRRANYSRILRNPQTGTAVEQN
jgi:hypothetical protein